MNLGPVLVTSTRNRDVQLGQKNCRVRLLFTSSLVHVSHLQMNLGPVLVTSTRNRDVQLACTSVT